MSGRLRVQLLVFSAAREVHRVVPRKGDQSNTQRLRCPYGVIGACSLDCALIGATEDHGGVALLWCRGGGNRTILGMPDPERTDLDEMLALTGASAYAEQVQAEDEREKR